MFGVDPISVLPFSTIETVVTVVIEGFILLCSPYMDVPQANGSMRYTSVNGSIESPLISATVEPLPCND